ncbi:gluconokinase [Caldalkalibacillus mannanilyticus]|uniref:gluconokinase n=1 Tax=Caldalkalibacillus mannanilyticus TaxID=1418 RepID=UPI0004685196|nr:gluconokinase [Caldalkalibacillus mannanilyticus]
MSYKQYVIGLDIGTTSAKAVLFTLGGKVVAEAEKPYDISRPQPLWAEQDPLSVEAGCLEVLKQVMEMGQVRPEALCSVGISSAMHSLICVNEEGAPLSPSIIWADGRSHEQAKRVQDTHSSIYLRTGTPLHPMSPLAKLLWMKENPYTPYRQAKRFVSIKEFILYRWFGTDVIDYSMASATGLFNIHTFEWDQEALQLCGITEEQLSRPVPSTYLLQGLRPDIAYRIGIPSDLPFVLGGSDGPLANLGIGAIAAGDVAITIGTSGAIRQMTDRAQLSPNQETFCYAFTPQLWITGGPTNNGANVLQWIKNILGELEVEQAHKQNLNPYELLTALAEQANPGANGLLFLPYLNGERAPFWDANARGCYIGLSASHQKKDLIRAGLEGVIFSLYHIGEALEKNVGSARRIFASGGFARSSTWLQIVADMFQQPIEVPESHQSSAWGAAWLSLYALNIVPSLEAIGSSIPMKKKVIPRSEYREQYRQSYQIYQSLYHALKPTFDQLAQFSQSSQK